MPSPPAIRVGLVGYGMAGSVFHAPLLATTPGVELAAVVTSKADRQEQVRRDYPGTRAVPSADELWAMAGDLDLIVIASPNRTHVPLARTAILAGVPVVVDKPLAATAAEAQELVALARDRGVLLTVFQSRRWDGDFLTVRRLLDEGALGKVSRLESRYERWRPEPRPGWREMGDPSEAGGLLFDLGSHVVDQALLLFGDITTVYAEMDRRRNNVEVDDDVFVALHHKSGVRSHLWMSVVASNIGPRFRVLGDRAAYVKFGMDPQENALRAGDRPSTAGWGAEPPEAWGRVGVGDDSEPIATETGAYPAFYAGVVATLRTGAPPPVDPAEAVTVLTVLESARTAADERRVVEVGAGH